MEQAGEIGERRERIGVILAEDFPAEFESFDVERLGLFVPVDRGKQRDEVVYGAERAGVAIAPSRSRMRMTPT